MDKDLERSVRFLEDATSSLDPGFFETTSAKAPRSLIDFSLSIFPEEQHLFRRDNASIQSESKASLMSSAIQTQHPWNNAINILYSEFAETLQISGNDMLKVAAEWSQCCSDALTILQNFKSKTNFQEIPDEKWLDNERNNWRLLYILYKDRLHAPNSDQENYLQYTGTSEKLCVEYLFKRESLIRESQLVIDWLERNALEKNDPILNYSDWTYGWENTLHQLVAPDSIAIGSNTDIVKNVYPDAPQFQNLSLHHLDNANEKQFFKRIFTEIRCGKLEDAQELCFNCGHPWRAAMLEGWKLFHNPNVKNELQNGDDFETMAVDEYDNNYQDVEGNAIRDLWKFSALEFCKKCNVDVHERAAIASLCGSLDPLLSICKTWEDHLWAYMRTMVDIRVESEIRDCIIKNYKQLPDEYWDQKLSLDEIFTNLESSSNGTVRSESQETDHIIQKHIILNQIPQLVDLLEQWAGEDAVSTNSLRFFAHLILFFNNVGETFPRNTSEKIIEAYISRLSEMSETQLVAFYSSKLGKRKQVIIYAAHLEKVVDTEDRKAALKFAEDFSLDVPSITKRVVESIRSLPNDLESSTLHGKLTKVDEMKISALDWLIFYEEQRVEALIQTNALIFKFLTMGKIDAAQLAINKIPQNSVSKIRSEGGDDEETEQIIKEHLSYKAYLDAHEAFNAWFKQFTNKPSPPADLPETAQFTEKVAHQHRVSQYKAEIERWKLTTAHSANQAKTLLYNVLLFPHGWLQGGQDSDYLRSICIPEVVLLLYSVLSESGLHQEAVQLADLIASEKSGIYKVYSKEKLGEILEKICESSMALLNEKKDPWGNAANS